MTESPGIRVLVVSSEREHGEAVNVALRSSGSVALVDWVDGPDEVGEALVERTYDVVFVDFPEIEPAKVVTAAAQVVPPLPVIGLAQTLDAELLTRGVEAGFRDLATRDNRIHLAAIVRREVAALRNHREIAAIRARADSLTKERDSLFDDSGDALARIEDGIVFNANGAWGELFGEDNAVEGTSVMDLFKAEGRKALKAALRGSAPTELDLVAAGTDDVAVPVTIVLRPLAVDTPGRFEIAIRSGKGQRTLAEELERARREDRDTGMLNRDAFLETFQAKLDATLVLVRIDHFARVVEQMGVLGSNEVAVQFAQMLRRHMNPGLIAGRIEGTLFGILMPSTAIETAREWCERISAASKDMAFEHNKRSTALTASFGLRAPGATDANTAIEDAIGALRGARSGGGDRIEIYTEAKPADEGSKISDAEWGKRIVRALKEKQFRLALQPVASLHGEESQMSDMLLRMQDPEHGEILPGEFLPAGERLGLMNKVDQWVVAQAVGMLRDTANAKNGSRLIVRLSDQSLKDGVLIKWLSAQLSAKPLPPGRLIIEVSEKQVETRLKDARAMGTMVRGMNCALLMSRFGAAETSPQMLESFQVEYIKLDTEVLAGITKDPKRAEALKTLLKRVKQKGIPTIAPQVEDANSMALLWQIGVDFVQGNYLQEPEVIIADQ